MPRLPLTLVALLGLAASPALAVTPQFGVGAQYDTTHVYVAPGDVDAFVNWYISRVSAHLAG